MHRVLIAFLGLLLTLPSTLSSQIRDAAELLSQLDKLLALFQSIQSVGPEQFQPFRQSLVRTIPYTNPNQSNRSVAQDPAVNEILIFADDNGVLRLGALPNYRVIRFVQAQVENVRRFMALVHNPSRQRGRQLSVDEEFQVSCSTEWSVCFAA